MSGAAEDAATSPVVGTDILIVDDTPTNLELLAEMLTRRGFHVRQANSGRRALAAVQHRLPDMVLLDISMPVMDGFEVCRQLKADAATRGVPVIFLSSLDEVVDKVKAFDVGAVDYVSKPFEFGEVLVRIENQLKIARLQRETLRQNELLARRNDELVALNQELTRSREREADMFSAFAEVLPGTVLDGRYRIEEMIGVGGFGAVYRARQVALDRPVAVKVLNPRMRSRGIVELDRFLAEGVSTCRVNHPNAVVVFDSGTASGIAYLVMELLVGQTLAQLLAEGGTMSPRRAVEIVAPLCRVLGEAHAVGVLHRDVKPENVFLHRVRGEEVVKLVDFGIAKLAMGESGNDSQLVGSPHYLAPERLRRAPYDGRADVYALGVTLYRALGGRMPMDDSELSDWLVTMGTDAAPSPRPLKELNPDVPDALGVAVRRALAPDQQARPTAFELERLLVSALGD